MYLITKTISVVVPPELSDSVVTVTASVRKAGTSSIISSQNYNTYPGSRSIDLEIPVSETYPQKYEVLLFTSFSINKDGQTKSCNDILAGSFVNSGY